MAIRIPRATDAGLGEALPGTLPHPIKPELPKYVAPAQVTGAKELAMMRLDLAGRVNPVTKAITGGVREVMNMGFLALEKEAASKAEVDLLRIKSDVGFKTDAILNDNALDAKGKADALKGVFGDAKQAFADKIPSRFHNIAAPKMEAVYLSEEARLNDHLVKKAKEDDLAHTIEALTLLESAAANGQISMPDAIKDGFRWIDTDSRSPVEKDKAKKTFVSSIYTNDILKRINAGDLSGLLKDLSARDKEGNPLAYPGMDSTERELHVGKIMDEVGKVKRQQEADKNEWLSGMKDRLDIYKDMKLAGFPVPGNAEVELYKQVKGTELEPLFNAIKKTGESAEHMLKKFEEDPLMFGAARLGIDVQPLNFADMSTLPAALSARAAIAANVKAASGLDYLPVLMSGEAKALSAYLKKDIEGAGISLIEGLTSIAGPEAVSGISRQLAKDDPQNAVVVNLIANGDVSTAKLVAKGRGLIESKSIVMPPDKELRRAFNDHAGSSLDMLAEDRGAAFEAFKSYYASLAATGGANDGDFDASIAKAAFKSIVGNTTEWNGRKVLIPDDMDEETFLNSLKRIGTNVLGNRGGVLGVDDNQDAAGMLYNNGHWYRAANGKYRALYGGSPVYLKNGGYLEFTTKELFDLSTTEPLQNKSLLPDDSGHTGLTEPWAWGLL